jgi:hypothetical protein
VVEVIGRGDESRCVVGCGELSFESPLSGKLLLVSWSRVEDVEVTSVPSKITSHADLNRRCSMFEISRSCVNSYYMLRRYCWTKVKGHEGLISAGCEKSQCKNRGCTQVQCYDADIISSVSTEEIRLTLAIRIW